MRKAILVVTVLFIAVISTACINNFAVQELNNKAKVYLDSGDYEAAINRLQASIDLDSTIFETHYNLGIAYIKNKQYKKAIEALSKAIDLNSECADAYYSLAIAQEAYAEELCNNYDNVFYIDVINNINHVAKNDVHPNFKGQCYMKEQVLKKILITNR